jgi:hypothetical protein
MTSSDFVSYMTIVNNVSVFSLFVMYFFTAVRNSNAEHVNK